MAVVVQIDKHLGAGYEDWTAYVDPFPDMSVENTAGDKVGSVVVPFTDPPVPPQNDWGLRVTDGGVELFEGLIRGIQRLDEAQPGSDIRHTCTGAGFDSLLDDDWVPRVWRSANETDAQRIQWLVNTYSTHGLTAGANVQSIIGAMPGGEDGRPEQEFGPSSLRAAIAKVTAISGGKIYVDFDKDVHHYEDEAIAAPFNLSDQPNDVTTFAYYGFSLEESDFPRVDQVEVFGAQQEQGAGLLHVTRTRAGAPAAEYRRVRVISDEKITSVEQAEAAGDAVLALNPGRVTGKLKTIYPGLRAGQTVQITHSGHGLSAEPFRIHSVTATPDTDSTFVYDVVFGDEPPSLSGILAGEDGIAGAISRLQSTQQSITDEIADLSVGGGNLIRNSGFDLPVGSEWSVGSNWAAHFAAADAYWAGFEARAMLAAQTAGDLATEFIDVQRLDDYWFSAWIRIRAYTSGTFRFELREYNAAGTLQQTTTIEDRTAADSTWVRASMRFGPNDQLGRRAFHANTTKVKLVFLTTGSSTMTAAVDGAQLERGRLLTAYAPRPQELAEGAITETMIADNAITTPKLAANAVVAGKVAADTIGANEIQSGVITANHIDVLDLSAEQLILRDPAGETALSAAGFGPTWRRFVANLLYNSDFYAAPPTPASNLNNTTNPLPFWSSPAGPDVTAKSIADASVPSGRVIRLAQAGTGQVFDTITQEVPLPAPQAANLRYIARASFRNRATIPATTTAVLRVLYYTSADVLISYHTQQIVLTDYAADTVLPVTVYPPTDIPKGTALLRVQAGIFRQAGNDAGEVDVCDVRLVVVERDVPTSVVKTPARLATAAALPAHTELSATQLEANANGPLTIDGVAAENNDRLLVKDETNYWKNGLYNVTERGQNADEGIVEVTTQRVTASTGGGTSEIEVGFPAAPTTGHLRVVVLGWRGDATITTVPTGWTLAKAGGNGSGIDSAIYYSIAQAGDPAAVVFGFSAAVKIAAVGSQWSNGSGWQASPVDKTNSNTATGTAGTTGATGVLAQAAELVISAFANIDSSASWSAHDNSQTEIGEASSTGGTPSGRNTVSMGARIVSATTSINYGATLSASNVWSSAVATFKPNAVSNPGAKWKLTETDDNTLGSDGALVPVLQGTINADSLWMLSNPALNVWSRKTPKAVTAAGGVGERYVALGSSAEYIKNNATFTTTAATDLTASTVPSDGSVTAVDVYIQCLSDNATQSEVRGLNYDNAGPAPLVGYTQQPGYWGGVARGRLNTGGTNNRQFKWAATNNGGTCWVYLIVLGYWTTTPA